VSFEKGSPRLRWSFVPVRPPCGGALAELALRWALDLGYFAPWAGLSKTQLRPGARASLNAGMAM